MKTSLAPTPDRSGEIHQSIRPTVPVTDDSFKSGVSTAAAKPASPQRPRVELTNFRTLSRSFFGAEAGREYLKEAIVFAGMMVVAAWPLAVTLNMLGTMMISPPPWMVNGTLRFIG